MVVSFNKTAIALAAVIVLGASVVPQRISYAAGMPVIDAAAIAQLVQQIRYWQQQIQGMTNQFNQQIMHYRAITGGRGMEALLSLSNFARNHLPPDYAELMNVLNNSSVSYSGLGSQVQNIMNGSAVLTRGQLEAMSPEQRRIITQGRQAGALLQMLSQQAQQNTSQRFAALQQLINAIGAAGDDKAIQDLQGRIAAEQTMLTVEQTKMQALYQMAQAQEMQRKQMVREGASRSAGSSASAWSPSFPTP